MKTASKNTPARSTAPQHKVILANPIQVALFKEALLPEIIGENGRWNKVRPFDHAEALKVDDLMIRARRGDEQMGFNFYSPKVNYNFNDSRWVNDETVTPRLLAIASAAAKREVSKKELYQNLEGIKEILKASVMPAKPEAAPVGAPAANDAAPVSEQIAA